MKNKTKSEKEMESYLPLQRGPHDIGGSNQSYRINRRRRRSRKFVPNRNNLRNIGTRTMGKDKVIMIIEVRFRKYKKDTHSMIHGACSNQEHR